MPFFTEACFNNRDDIHASNIPQSINNPTRKLYLQFLEYILPLFINLNVQMQSEKPQIKNLYTSVTTAAKTILDCFIKPEVLRNKSVCDVDFRNPRSMLSLVEMYFGAAVAATSLERRELESLKTKCLSSYIGGVEQIIQRFPLKNNREDLPFLNPQSVREKSISSIAKIAAKWPNLIDRSKLQILDKEWRLLKNYDLHTNTATDIFEFWSNIAEIKCGDNSKMFSNLTEFIFNILIVYLIQVRMLRDSSQQ